jgi:ribose-phosphate pyrophosphokinase
MSNIKVITPNGKEVVEFHTFSDGTEKLELDTYISTTTVATVVVDIKDATRDLTRIGLVKDALDRLQVSFVNLYLPYMPQARADRVFQEGAALPIKVFASILNSYGFSEVVIEDPHSDVTPALIDNVVVVSQAECFQLELDQIKEYMPEFTICAPDIGAAKKAYDVAKALGHSDVVQGLKIRDVTTGTIVKCGLDREIVPENVLMIDDISDGGASFKFLAQKLKEKGAKKVGLYVTHGIFTNGLKALEGYVDFIFIRNQVGNYFEMSELEAYNKAGK